MISSPSLLTIRYPVKCARGKRTHSTDPYNSPPRYGFTRHHLLKVWLTLSGCQCPRVGWHRAKTRPERPRCEVRVRKGVKGMHAQGLPQYRSSGQKLKTDRLSNEQLCRVFVFCPQCRRKRFLIFRCFWVAVFAIFVVFKPLLHSVHYQFVAAKQQTGRKKWDQTVITRWSGASSDFYFCLWRVIPNYFGISSHDASKFKLTKF